MGLIQNTTASQRGFIGRAGIGIEWLVRVVRGRRLGMGHMAEDS